MKAKTRPKRKPDPGAIRLILAAILLAAIGSFLADYRQVPFGLFGGVIWVIALLVSFMFGMLFFAQFVLPIGGSESWSEGLRLLGRHYGSLAGQYMERLFAPPPPRLRPASAEAAAMADPYNLSALPPSFSLFQAGMVRSYHALATVKGASFARAVGPGFVILYGESVSHVIDLRKHVRSQPVKASTRDGIPLDTSVSVTFRVRQASYTHADENLPHPYDKDAIFHVTYANSIDGRDRLHPWTEQLTAPAATLLITELAKYKFNELFQIDDEITAPLDSIKQTIQREMAQVADQSGIELLSVGVGKFTLPESVKEQRVKTWQAEWQRRIQERSAASDAEAVRRIQKARARAQIDIIEHITENLEFMHRVDDTHLSEIITLRMIEALEEAMTDTSMQTLVPQQMLTRLVTDTATQMQEWLNQPPEDQPS